MLSSLRPTPIAQLSATNVSQITAARRELGEKTLSFEFFPPRDEAAEITLWRTFDAIMQAGADYVSVTYGAGGSNQERTLAVTERMAPQIATIGHLTCVGATKAHSSQIIKSFEDHGVSSVLALRGDSPKDNPNALLQGELKTALDLVNLTREVSSLEVGVAAFPEVHPESPSLSHDVHVLKLKESAGAKFAITQLFFSVDAYLELVNKAEAAGIALEIIPGVMPIANAKQVLRMAEMSNAKVPTNLYEQLADADAATARRIGMDYTLDLGAQLLAIGAPGLHIFTLNQQKAALELAEGVGLVR
ncbi:MAG: hypothetical protein RL556_536 [Actinomycetota bacterium]|jgi:methylenetetrahydrofolate reductase (NADPH)